MAELNAQRHGSASGAIVDVRDLDALGALVEEVVERHGRLDVMVNNAGIEQPLVQVIDTNEDIYREVMDTNLWGVIAGTRAAGRVMKAQGSGAIINTASQLGKVAFETWGVYSASKAGVISITQAAARELAREGVRVNAICPGTFDTPLAERAFTLNAEQRGHLARGDVRELRARPDRPRPPRARRTRWARCARSWPATTPRSSPARRSTSPAASSTSSRRRSAAARSRVSSATQSAPSALIAIPCGSLAGGSGRIASSPSKLTWASSPLPHSDPDAVGLGGDHGVRLAVAVGQRELLDRVVHRDPPELAGEDLGEPDGVVGGGDPDRPGLGRRQLAHGQRRRACRCARSRSPR